MNKQLTKDWLYDQYIVKNKTVSQICQEFDLKRDTVAHKLSYFKIKKTNNDALYKNKKWLYNQYIELNKSQKEISELCSVQQSTIWRYLKKYNIIKEEQYVYTKDFLFEEHVIKHKSMLQIAKETGHNNTVVKDYLEKYNIPIWTCHDNTNEYIDKDHNITEVKVYNQYGEYVNSFIIDTNKKEYIKQYKWILVKDNIVPNRSRYRVVTGSHPSIVLGRFLLNITDDNLVVDHIDNNPLNNLSNNLRIVNRTNNQTNHDIHKNNTSGFTGVYYDKRKNKWGAQIKYKRISSKLGLYTNKEDAIYARYFCENKLFKNYRSNRNDINILIEIDKCNNKKNIEKYINNIISQKWGEVE